MKVTFSDLKDISESLEKGNEQVLVDYLNRFEGINVYQKFKNVLKVWDLDVSSNLSLNIGDRTMNISFSYLLSEFPENLGKELVVNYGNLNCNVDVPIYFSVSDETVPIYDILQRIEIGGISMDLFPMSHSEKRVIIDRLPPTIYTKIIDGIIKQTDKRITFQNPSLSSIKLNFLTNDPYNFLRGLFLPYSKNYFRDILFSLSKRLDSHVILNSTIQDVEYYIERYSEEMKSNEQTPSMG